MMNNTQTINADILSITMTIQQKYPELSKYLLEMPVTIPNVLHPDIDLKILEDYYESLHDLLKKYTISCHFVNRF